LFAGATARPFSFGWYFLLWWHRAELELNGISQLWHLYFVSDNSLTFFHDSLKMCWSDNCPTHSCVHKMQIQL
jgi:hypothetical protein